MINMKLSQENRVKNEHPKPFKGDFKFSVFAFIGMILISLVILGIGSIFLPSSLSAATVLRTFFGVAAAALVYAFFPWWLTVLPAVLLGMTGFLIFPEDAGFLHESLFLISAIAIFIPMIFGTSMQVIPQWDKAVILRMGSYHRVKGPGVFFLLPMADRCAAIVDTRIRVTDFTAEKILTKDTVPIYVDALAFWMIWDPKKSILEVENFLQAVTLSAQAALRDCVGRYELSEMLSQREKLYSEIQSILDSRTNSWGITILSVDFVDIRLPSDLEDVMSRQAQAEREKNARLLLGEAELEVSKKFEAAALAYKNNPEALNLRAMTMVYDGMKSRGSLVLIPSSALDSMNLGSVLGTISMGLNSQNSVPGTVVPGTTNSETQSQAEQKKPKEEL